jgi:hypothetical protein
LDDDPFSGIKLIFFPCMSIWWKYCMLMYENGKTRLLETIPGMRKGE